MRRLVFRPAARRDLEEIFTFIAADNRQNAAGHVAALRAACRQLCAFPNMGVERPEIRPGLRIFVLRRRVLVAYRVLPDRIVVLRVLSGGQDYAVLLGMHD